MMMKIFGAALIISGGYLLGRVRLHQYRIRITALKEVCEQMEGFERAIAEYRCSAKEYFEERGDFGRQILEGCLIKGLVIEDQNRINDLFSAIAKAGYASALVSIREYLSHLSSLIATLEEETATTGKALPIVTATIGFMVAVFLF